MQDVAVLDDAGGWLSDAVGSVTSVVKKVAHTASSLNPVSRLAGVASNIAQGKNVVDQLKRAAKAELGAALANARLIAPIASTFPGIGTAAGAALTVAAEIGAGHSLKDAAIAAARNSVPGGVLGKAAFDVGVGLASGQRIDTALLASARKALPNDAARAAMDLGVAAIKRKRFDPSSALRSGAALAIPEVARRAGVSSILPHGVDMVARGLLSKGSLRGLPLSTVAQRFGVSEATAREAAAAAVRVVSGKARGLAHAPELARAIPAGMTFDTLMAKAGSRGAPPKQGPNERGRRRGPSVRFRVLPRAVAARIASLPALRGRIAHVIRMTGANARGLDSTGTRYIVEAGDWPNKIAGKLGHMNGGQTLILANPQKTTTRDAKTGLLNFKSLSAGESLRLPSGWGTAAPTTTTTTTTTPTVTPLGTTPMVTPTVTPTSTSKPAPTSSVGVSGVQGMLAVWASTDGAGAAVPKDFGTGVNDFDGTNNTRYGLCLDSFRVWSNGARGTRLPLSGPLDDATYDALYQWATEYVAKHPTTSGGTGAPATPAPGTSSGAGMPVPKPPAPGSPGSGIQTTPGTAGTKTGTPAITGDYSWRGAVGSPNATPGATPGAGAAPASTGGSGTAIALAAAAALAFLS